MNTGYKIQNVIGRFENGVFQIQYDFTSNPNATPTDLVNATGMSLQRATELINSRYVLDLVDCPVPQYGTIQFEQISYTVQEPNIGVTNLAVTLIRQSGCNDNVTATIDVVGGTALPINDYTNIFPTTVTWLDGDCSNKTITIPIVGDTLDEANETIILGITNITNASLGTNTQTTITIVDNDTDYIVNVINSNTSTCNVTGIPIYPYNQTVIEGGSISLPINTSCLVTAVLINGVNQLQSVINQANTGTLTLTGIMQNTTVELIYGNFPCQVLTLNPDILPNFGTTFYSTSLSTSGGTAPYTYSLISGSLPNGFTLNSSTGVISGTAANNGVFNFVVRSTDVNGCFVDKNYVLESICPIISVGSPLQSCFTIGQTINDPINVAGGVPPYTYNSQLHSGLTLDSSTGIISGTFTSEFNGLFTTSVTDSNGCVGSSTYLTTVYNPLNFQITNGNPPDGTVGSPYSFTFTAIGGEPSVQSTMNITGSIPGLTTSGATPNSITLSGAPITAGSYSLSVTAYKGQCNITTSYLITIA